MTTPARPLHVLTPREASIFACLTETMVAPQGTLPHVRDTDAVFALDETLAAAPALNVLGVRALLLVVEIAPRAFGERARLRRLTPEARARFLDRAMAHPLLGGLLKPLQALAQVSYYGDDTVMRGLGYDAGAVVARGRALRAAEARW